MVHSTRSAASRSWWQRKHEGMPVMSRVLVRESAA
jgi:hypothetical protein